MNALKLVVVIPAYNEAKVISEVISAIPKKLSGVSEITTLVVDDHSLDNTRELAEKAGAKSIRHKINLGAGGATITGLEAAKRLGADIIVTMDADGQHKGEDMTTLIEPILQGDADVVLGSRMKQTDRAMPSYKVLGNNLLNIVTFLFFGIWVSDSQSGYKAFSKEALKKIKLSANGYEYCSEIIGEIKKRRLKYKEVTIQTIYTPYSKSKGQLALNAINIVLGLLTRGIRS